MIDEIRTRDGRTMAISGNYLSDIARAVEAEHPCSDDSACDIASALEQGFPATAAFLLGGATETDLLDAVIKAHEENGTAPGRTVDGFPDDWADWVEWHKANAIHCEACNAYNYPSEGYGPQSCGNCLAALPEPQEAEEEAGDEVETTDTTGDDEPAERL